MWNMSLFHAAQETVQACGISGGGLMKKHMSLISLRPKPSCEFRYLIAPYSTVQGADKHSSKQREDKENIFSYVQIRGSSEW